MSLSRYVHYGSGFYLFVLLGYFCRYELQLCFAPIGEDEQTREIRIRQYEDFFNVSGMGTPDDLEEFRACQEGFHGDIAEWNDLSRGATRWLDGADENAKTLGFNPVQSTIDSTDEGLLH